jgi:hypothetical protein
MYVNLLCVFETLGWRPHVLQNITNTNATRSATGRFHNWISLGAEVDGHKGTTRTWKIVLQICFSEEASILLHCLQPILHLRNGGLCKHPQLSLQLSQPQAIQLFRFCCSISRVCKEHLPSFSSCHSNCGLSSFPTPEQQPKHGRPSHDPAAEAQSNPAEAEQC